MSILAMLDRLEEDGKLVRYLPAAGPELRRLYLGDRLALELLEQRSAINFFDQRLPVVNLFDRWIMGRPITVRRAGRATGAFLAELEPPPADIWEFRVTEPRPQLRIFARFAAPDVLVALLARNRDRLGSASTARGKSGKAWLEAMYGCETEWKRICGGAIPFRGRHTADYVTRNAEECP